MVSPQRSPIACSSLHGLHHDRRSGSLLALMGSRVLGFGLLFTAAIAAMWIVRPSPGMASVTCPPVTIEDLVARSRSTTTSTLPEVPQTESGDTTTTTTTAAPVCDSPFVYRLVFPIMGGGTIGSPFGATRDGGRRLHEGNDLFAPRLQPVVAVAPGTVTRIGPDTGISGFRVIIRHGDGWSSYYIHLNNDTLGTDDGSGIGIRPDLEVGDRVEAGQVIGWVGDSGNAEDSSPHLHFELHDPAGVAVDPGPSLRAAARTSPPSASSSQFDGPFTDTPAGEQADPMALLLTRGAPTWCDETGVISCPDDPATPADVSAWLTPLVGPIEVAPGPRSGVLLPEVPGDCSETLACLPDRGRGETILCSVTQCPSPGVTQDDLARAIAWDRLRDAYELAHVDVGRPLRGGPGAFTTPPPPSHPYDLDPIQAYDIIGPTGCPDPRAGAGELSRHQAAAAIASLLGLADSQCVFDKAEISASSR